MKNRVRGSGALGSFKRVYGEGERVLREGSSEVSTKRGIHLLNKPNVSEGGTRIKKKKNKKKLKGLNGTNGKSKSHMKKAIEPFPIH